MRSKNIGDKPVYPHDRELIGWLTGALEPGEASRLAGEIAASRRLRARLDVLRTEMQDPIEDEDDPLVIPPPGVRASRSPLHGQVSPLSLDYAGGSAGASQERGSDTTRRWRVTLQAPDDADRVVVLLHRAEGRWRVLEPSSEEIVTHLHELRREGNGYTLEISTEVLGAQRYAIALPRVGEADPAWALPEDRRWDALRAAISGGDLPLLSLELGAEDPQRLSRR